ncbi:MAG: Exopolyphosphatase [Ignavibacteriae bacterium]|nr:MAG: Exopolyphosphatase [Ignavibacteriota bacterium]
MKIAVIDIGTNTVLLLIAKITNGVIETLAYEQRTPRLGKNIDAEGVIGKPAFTRVLEVLKEYKKLIEEHNPDKIVAFGTSVLREVANKEEFLAFIKNEIGFDIEILTSDEEAYWSYRGAVSGIRENGNIVVIDIGGGSTEISQGSLTEVKCTNSINVGAVRITERFFKNNPPTQAEINLASEFIKTAIEKLGECKFTDEKLIGVAGTPTTLASIDLGLKDFDVTKISGHRMSFERIQEIFKKLCKMKSEEIRELSNATEGRADIITAGTLILIEFMKYGNFKEIIVSERGVRYGVAIREWEKNNS